MAEMAPNLYVSPVVPEGTVIIIDMNALKLAWESAQDDDRGKGVAIHPTDWDRFPGEFQERLIDALTRAGAERGFAMIQGFLKEADRG